MHFYLFTSSGLPYFFFSFIDFETKQNLIARYFCFCLDDLDGGVGSDVLTVNRALALDRNLCVRT